MCACQHQHYDYICDFACPDCGHAMAIDTAGHLQCIKRGEPGHIGRVDGGLSKKPAVSMDESFQWPNGQGRFELVYSTLRLLDISHAFEISHAFKKINDGT